MDQVAEVPSGPLTSEQDFGQPCTSFSSLYF